MKLPKSAIKIWSFELYHNSIDNFWYVCADNKVVYKISDNRAEEAWEAMKFFNEAWEEGDVNF